MARPESSSFPLHDLARTLTAPSLAALEAQRETARPSDLRIVDAAWFDGLCDAIRKACGVAARDLGPEHTELHAWLQRARTCAEAA